MKYSGTLIAVDDIKKSRKFYEDMFGLEVYQDFGRNISFTCGLALQEDYDWLVNIPKDTILKKTNNMELYFDADDFDGFVEKLRKHKDIELLHDVREYEWGQRSVHFYDPDGHIIEVGENMKDVVIRFLDSGLSMEDTSKRTGIEVTDLEAIMKN